VNVFVLGNHPISSFVLNGAANAFQQIAAIPLQ
jgi:hypothetical protein